MKQCRCLKQFLIFCIIICFFLSIDGFAKDISFDEVPEAIQKIALRIIGDVPIDDVDREEDDGDIVYDIEARDDKIEIELEIAAADGTLLQRDITEEITFSELPVPVQDTVRQQVGALKINDVERRTELGRRIVGNSLQSETTYYKVEAEELSVEIELEIAPDGKLLDIDISDPIRLKVKLLAKSKVPTLADIAPYREALVFYEYSVRKRLEGGFKGKKLRVAHWAIYDNQPQAIGEAEIGSSRTLHLYPYQQFSEFESLYTSDTLALDADIPLYHDVGQKILENRTVEERYDYDSIFSEKMPIFWRIKDQLKLVSLGDSRGEAGVRAELFYGEENRKTPIAYNLAISGGPLEFQEIVVDKYLLKMPSLEWVVYQMSPRAVNRYFEHSADRQLLKSRGFAFDRKHAETLWRGSEGEAKKTAAEIAAIPYVSEYWNERPWGWKFKAEVWDRPETEKFEREWEISKKRWDRLTAMIAALNERDVKVLLYLSPLHPIMRGQPVVDDDGTTQKGYRELVDRLKQLEAQFPNFVFVDLLQGGNHDFLPEMFKDLDHLNALGAAQLTQQLEEIRQRYDGQHP